MLSILGRATVIGRLRYQLWERHYSVTIRLMLILICLGLTTLSAVLFRNTYLIGMDFIRGLLPVLALLLLAGFIAVYYNLQIAVVGTLVISTLLADGIGTGTGTKLTFTFLTLTLLTVIWLFKMLVVERRLKILQSPGNIPAVLFMVAVVISLIWSSVYVDLAVSWMFGDKLMPRLMTTVVMIISVATYFLFANHVHSISAMKFFAWWFIILGVLLCLFRLSGDIPAPLNTRGQFPTWVTAMALGQVFFNRNLKWQIKVVLSITAAIWFYITLGLGLSWLSGWLPLTLFFLLLLFFYSRKLFSIVLIGIVIYISANEAFVQRALSQESAESGNTREEAWGRALDLTEDHFLFGTGPAGYAFYFATYLGPVGFSHNNYVDIYAQTGLVGLGIFLWFWLAMLRLSWRLYWVLPKGDFRHGLGMSLIAANITTMVVMMFGDWVIPFTYTQTLSGIDYTIWAWMIAGLTVALYHHCKNLPTQPAQITGLRS